MIINSICVRGICNPEITVFSNSSAITLLGPTVARIQNDLLTPVLMLVFKTLLRNNQFPPVPDQVKKLNAQFKVRYSGPLARSQKSDEVAAIERFIGQIGAMTKVFPKLQLALNPFAVAREMAMRLGVPGDLLYPQDKIDKDSAQMDKMQAQAQQAQLAQESGKGAQELTKANAMAGGPGGQQQPQ